MSERDVDSVLEKLSVLEPTEAPISARVMLNRIQNEVDKPSPWAGFWQMGQVRWATAIVTMTLALVVLFSIPSVQVAASNFLGLFRVQTFATVDISPEQIAALEGLAEQGIAPGQLELLSEPTEPEWLANIAEANAKTNYLVKTLPLLGTPEHIRWMDGVNGRFTLDATSLQTILSVMQASDEVTIPEGVDGLTIEIMTSASIEQKWAGDLILWQTPSPTVTYPEGVNAAQLGRLYLQLLGLSEAEIASTLANIDWTTTLLLPVPQGMVTADEVTVRGQSGLQMRPLEGAGYMLVWQEAGIVYMLASPNSNTDLLVLAEGLTVD